MTNPRDTLLIILPARLAFVEAYAKLHQVLDIRPPLFSPEEEGFLVNNMQAMVNALEERYRILESDLGDENYEHDD